MHETLEALPRLRRPAAANAAEYWFAPERFARRCGRLGDRFTVPMPATGPWLCLTDPGDIQRVFTADTDVLRFGAALAKTSPHLLLLGPAGLTNVDGPANAAVDHMVALAADELGGIGIRVNGIRPGIVASELRDPAGHLGMSQVTLDSWVHRGWADGYLHPEARLIVVRADPAEAERLRALHHMPRGTTQPAPLAEKSGRPHKHRPGRNRRQCRRATAMTALRLARLDALEVLVGGNHGGGVELAGASARSSLAFLITAARTKRPGITSSRYGLCSSAQVQPWASGMGPCPASRTR